MAQNVIETIFRLKSDEAAQRRLLNDTKEISRALKTVGADLGALNPVSQAAANTLDRDFARVERNINSTLIEARRFRNELETLDDVVVTPEIRVKQAGGGSNSISGVERTDRLGSISSQIFSGLGQGELANAAGLVGDVAGAAGSLGTLGIAAAALAPVIGLVTSQIAANIEREKQRIEILKQVASVIAQGTRDEAEARIKALQDDIAVQQIYIGLIEERTGRDADYLASLNDVSLANTSAATSAIQLYELFGNNLISAANGVDQANAAIEDNQFFIDALNKVLGENATAANDAAEAERNLLSERNPLADIAEDYKNRAVQLAQYGVQLDGLTTAQRDAEEANLQRQIQILGQYRTAYEREGNAAAAAELTRQMALLEEKLNLVSGTTNTLADQQAQLAAVQAALSTQTNNYFKALEAEVRAQEALFTAQERQRAEYEKYIADGLKISVEAQEQLDKIIAESGERQADIVRKTQDAIAKIERDYGRDRFTAVAERDALAAYQAGIRAKDQLDDARKAEEDQLKEAAKAQDKALRSLKENIQKQAAALDAGYRAQQQATVAAINRATVDLVNAKNAEANIAAYGAGTQRAIHSQMWGDLTMMATNYAQAMVNSVGFILGGAYTGSTFTQYPFSVGGQQPAMSAQTFDRRWDARYAQYARVAQTTR